MARALDVEALRRQFPALARRVAGRPAVFFDGPAGSQVPTSVIDAVAGYFRNTNANHGGVFATSVESDALLAESHRALADFLGAGDPRAVVFGANMTSLTLAFSRALARTWQPGDEVIVTRLDHDANITPWVLAARDAGATVRWVELNLDDCTLELDSFERALSPRTRLVALGCASNSVGTINPIEPMIRRAHEAGAEVYLDAVHYAPHLPINVARWGADYLACSAYKFFGPHLGVLWGRPERLEELAAYKVRPAANHLPDKWMTGTQSHEAIVGAMAAVDYLADLGRQLDGSATSRPAALACAWNAITAHERSLLVQLLAGLAELRQVRVRGILAPERMHERVPTISFTHARYPAVEVARRLADEGVFVWHGNYYALALSEALGVEPEGMVRVGLLHYNTAEEVERLVSALRRLEP